MVGTVYRHTQKKSTKSETGNSLHSKIGVPGRRLVTRRPLAEKVSCWNRWRQKHNNKYASVSHVMPPEPLTSHHKPLRFGLNTPLTDTQRESRPAACRQANQALLISPGISSASVQVVWRGGVNTFYQIRNLAQSLDSTVNSTWCIYSRTVDVCRRNKPENNQVISFIWDSIYFDLWISDSTRTQRLSSGRQQSKKTELFSNSGAVAWVSSWYKVLSVSCCLF